MKKKKRTIQIGGLLFITLFILIGYNYIQDRKEENLKSDPKYVFTYAENQAEGYPTTESAKYFADLVFEKSEGKIKINVYAGGKLGDEVSVIEQMKYGGLDFARASVMTMGEYIPEMNVLQLPYLYNDSEHMWKVLNGEIGNEIMDEVQNYGLIALSWYDAGTRNFYTREKVETLEDFQGLKIRVAKSELMKALVSSFGATPIAMDYSDVYSALELGTIDGAENNWPSYETMEHYKVAKYMIVDEHNQIPELQLISDITWNKLSTTEQKIIKECALESSLYEINLWAKYVSDSKARAVEEGVVVTELEGEEKQKFKDAVMTVYNQLGPEYQDLIQRIILAGE